MKFTVLMSVYKNDNIDFFKLALESVTSRQTIKPAQVVIVEDFLTNCKEIWEKMGIEYEIRKK